MNLIPEQNEVGLEESVKQVMQTLPPTLRKYLASGQYSLVAKNLMMKYGMHIDQGSVLEREIMLLLMGIESPDEFAFALKKEALVSEDVMRSIMTDVNNEIFIPLQKQMREGGNGQQTAKPIPSPPPQPTKFVRPITSPQRPSAPAPSYQPPRPPPPPVPVQPVSKPIPPPQVVRQASPTPPPPPRPNPVQQQIPTKPDHLLPIGEQWKHVSAPLPPKTAMPWPEGKARPAFRPSTRPPVVQEEDSRPSPPPPEEMPGATGNAGWPPPTPQVAQAVDEIPVPTPPPPPSGGMPQKYIRTYGGDMETVQKGGAPDLVPIESAHKSAIPSVPESAVHPPTHSYTGDPYREPIE